MQRTCFLIASFYVSRRMLGNRLESKLLPNTKSVQLRSLHPEEEIMDVKSSQVRRSVSCNKAWRGDVEGSIAVQTTSIAVVVSFCEHDLDWLSAAFHEKGVASFTIYSKCGREEVAKQFFMKDSVLGSVGSVVKLPNIGRVDHTIAFDMLNKRMNANSDSVVVYLKDTYPIIHQRGLEAVPILDMVRSAGGPLGFGCGLRPKPLFPLDNACKNSNGKSIEGNCS